MRISSAVKRCMSTIKEYGHVAELGLPVQPTTFYLQRLKDTRLTLFVGDIDRMAEVLSNISTVNFIDFKNNRGSIATSAQFLDPDLGTVDNDFTVIKPVRFIEGRIRPKTNEWIIETSVSQANDVCSTIKYKSKKKQSLRMINLQDQVYSYRLFNLQTKYSTQVNMAGKLNKSFYPPSEHRNDTDDDDFLDVCAYHPKSHDLWYSIYSPNPDLDLQSSFVKPAEGWEYPTLRYYNRLPEYDECTDFKMSTIWPWPIANNINDYPGKYSTDGRRGMLTIAYVDYDNWHASGVCQGIAEHKVNKGITVPADTCVERSDGSRVLSVIASVNNVCLVFIDESCAERIFKLDNGMYIHVFENGVIANAKK